MLILVPQGEEQALHPSLAAWNHTCVLHWRAEIVASSLSARAWKDESPPQGSRIAVAAAIREAPSGTFPDLLFHALRSEGQGEALVIRVGVGPGHGWDIMLMDAATRHKDIATVSPLTAGDLPAPKGLGPGDMGRILYTLTGTEVWVTGRPRPDIFLLTARAREAARTSTAADFSALVRDLERSGLGHVLVSGLWAATPGQGAEEPDPALSRAVATAAGHGLHHLGSPGLDERPVILHVSHPWGGGAQKWIHDLAQADPQRVHVQLRSTGAWGRVGTGLELRMVGAGDMVVHSWAWREPLGLARVADLEYARALEHILKSWAVDAIMVTSLVGHTLEALATSLPTVFVAHDYFPFCPRIQICRQGAPSTDSGRTEVEACRTCPDRALEACLADGEHFRKTFGLGPPDPHDWLALRRRFLALLVGQGIPVAAPSGSVAENLCRLDPGFDKVRFTVVPHGEQALPPLDARTRKRTRRPRIVIPGEMQAHKGLGLVLEVLEPLTAMADLFFLGCGDQAASVLRGRPGVRVKRAYRRERLPALVAAIGVDLALLPPVWPETFSYTLSEMRMLGLPVLATRLGALAERIRDGHDGFLCPPRAQEIVATVARLLHDPQTLARVGRAGREIRPVPPAEMAENYQKLLPLVPGKAARRPLALALPAEDRPNFPEPAARAWRREREALKAENARLLALFRKTEALALERWQELEAKAGIQEGYEGRYRAVEALALEREEEISQLQARCAETHQAFKQAETLALERLREVMDLFERHKAVDTAFRKAETLALERLERIQALEAQEKRLAAALQGTENLALGRLSELQTLAAELEACRTALAAVGPRSSPRPGFFSLRPWRKK